MNSGKIRIKLKAYDHRILDRSAKEIVRVAEKTAANVVGPIPLPVKKSIYTVLRSPHVNKKSREQFEMRVHKRLIELVDTNPDTISSLINLDLPAGVDISIKML